MNRRSLLRTWDRVSIYLPIMLMGLLALGTYWLARNTSPAPSPVAGQATTHEPDYFMSGFSVRNFEPGGRLKTEIHGVEARHYPDTDTLEIDQPRIRAYNEEGVVTTATAKRALSNADGSPSEAFYHYIGGLQRYIPAAMALVAPYVNSYRRLSRHTAAPINIEWGHDNRTVGIRSPISSAVRTRPTASSTYSCAPSVYTPADVFSLAPRAADSSSVNEMLFARSASGWAMT